MEIINKKLKDLKPYRNNPRKNIGAIRPVKESILQFGFKVPIVIDQKNEIICGHTRYYASQEIGLETVPCIIAEDLNEEQIKAFRLVDNRTSEFADWNFELLAEELSDLADYNLDIYKFDELMAGLEDAFLIENKKELKEDNFNVEIPEEPNTQQGDLYQLGNHYLLCGDATKKEDLKKLIGNRLMDLCITDPPYNVSYEEKNQHLAEFRKTVDRKNEQITNDKMNNENFYNFLLEFYKRMFESLKKGGSFYIFHADSEELNFRNALINAGGRVRQSLIWVKNHFVLGFNDYHYKHEPILYGWKDGASHYFISEKGLSTVIKDEELDIDKLKKEDLQKLIKNILADQKESVIYCDKPAQSHLHPTMKPIKLFGELIQNSSKPKENVIDFFGGSGTTLIACEQLDRNCFILENDPRYCDVIIQRWEEFTGNEAKKL